MVRQSYFGTLCSTFAFVLEGVLPLRFNQSLREHLSGGGHLCVVLFKGDRMQALSADRLEEVTYLGLQGELVFVHKHSGRGASLPDSGAQVYD